MKDTQASEDRVRELVLEMAVKYDINLTIKFGRAKRTSGTWMWYQSGVHVLTFSRPWLWNWSHGHDYGTYPTVAHLWVGYPKLYGSAAEWAIVVHEFAHALQWEHEGRGNGKHHNGCFTRCVQELQREFPLERYGGEQPMFPPLDFTDMKPIVFAESAIADAVAGTPAPGFENVQWKCSVGGVP